MESKKWTVRFSSWIRPDQKKIIDADAKKRKVKKAEILRIIIDEYYKIKAK